MRACLIVCLSLAAAAAPGCGGKTEPSDRPAPDRPQFKDKEAVRKALLGAGADEVRKALGAPDDVEPSLTYPNSQKWEYRSLRNVGGGGARLFIILDDGRVSAVL